MLEFDSSLEPVPSRDVGIGAVLNLEMADLISSIKCLNTPLGELLKGFFNSTPDSEVTFSLAIKLDALFFFCDGCFYMYICDVFLQVLINQRQKMVKLIVKLTGPMRVTRHEEETFHLVNIVASSTRMFCQWCS